MRSLFLAMALLLGTAVSAQPASITPSARPRDRTKSMKDGGSIATHGIPMTFVFRLANASARL